MSQLGGVNMHQRQEAQKLKDDGMWEWTWSNKAWAENKELEEQKESYFFSLCSVCVCVRL